jgi:hypothetical protein
MLGRQARQKKYGEKADISQQCMIMYWDISMKKNCIMQRSTQIMFNPFKWYKKWKENKERKKKIAEKLKKLKDQDPFIYE